MRLARSGGIAAILALCSLAAACGRSAHGERHAAEKSTPAPPPPTPDTTPIDPLRTPAGLVLRINEPPTPAPQTGAPASSTTPSPAATATPQVATPTPASGAKAG